MYIRVKVAKRKTPPKSYIEGPKQKKTRSKSSHLRVGAVGEAQELTTKESGLKTGSGAYEYHR